MSLAMLSIGERAEVLNIRGGGKLKHYLTELGFTFGRAVVVIQRTVGSSLIVTLEGSRMALDRKVAHQIQITLEGVKGGEI